MKLSPCLACFLILITISSCEKDFLAPEQQGAGKMVVNSLFNDAGPMTVFITKSYGINSSSNYMTAIADAHVELYQDSAMLEVLHYVPSDSLATFGAYVSNAIPQAGKTYSVKIYEPSYGEATASDQIPVPAQNVSCQMVQFSESNGIGTATFNLSFTDNPNVQNYYRINTWLYGAQGYHINGPGDTTFYNYYQAIRPNLLTQLNDTVWDNEVFPLFSDRGFNGQTKQITLSFNSFNIINYYHLTLLVELHTVSQSHYEYFKTLQISETTNYNNVAAPVNVYSNVQNGYGVFAGEHWQSTPFVIK